MKINLNEQDRAELLKMWKAGVLETERISGLRDLEVSEQSTPNSRSEARALLFEIMREDGLSEKEIEEEKKNILREGEEPYYLMKYIKARRKRKETLSKQTDNELMRRIRDAEIELLELGDELKRV